MATVNASAKRAIGAPAATVYGYIADHDQHHPNFLPPNFSNFRVEQGGVGAGTVTRFTFAAGRRTREYKMRVEEPEPGRVMTESDEGSTLVTTWTVTPRGEDSCEVEIATSWQGAGGIGGFFEKRFAPGVLAKIYADELERLDRYARERAQA